VLATPWIAVFGGLVLGIALVAPLFWTIRRLNARNADVALYIVMGAVFGGLLVGLAVMTGYWLVTRDGFMFFGPATVAGFVIALGVLAVRAALSLLSDNDTEG
jgi:hypothetical protein